MDESEHKQPLAWQPLTPAGVAAFAQAPLGRLLVVQLVFALVAAATVTWFIATAWLPVCRQAILQMPAAGEVRSGKLDWKGDSPVGLAEGRFLSVSVDLAHEGEARSPAHLQVEFGRSDVKLFSLLGFVRQPYPTGWRIAFNRAELDPWSGAWFPPLLAITAGATAVGLLLIWAALASLYFLPVWLLGFFANRDLTFRRSWRLAGAALMPGALFLTAAIVVYGLGALDLVQLAAAVAIHFLIGWAFLLVSSFYVPPHPTLTSLPPNPFVPPPSLPRGHESTKKN
jgi:hypothetical protein